MNRVVRLVEVVQVTEVGDEEVIAREEQGEALNAEHLRMAEAILFAA